MSGKLFVAIDIGTTSSAVVGLVAYAAQRSEEAEPLHDIAAGVLARGKEKIKNTFEYKDFLEIAQKKKKGVAYV